MKKQKIKPFPLRVPEILWGKLMEIGYDKSKISTNQFLVDIFQEYVEKESKKQ